MISVLLLSLFIAVSSADTFKPFFQTAYPAYYQVFQNECQGQLANCIDVCRSTMPSWETSRCDSICKNAKPQCDPSFDFDAAILGSNRFRSEPPSCQASLVVCQDACKKASPIGFDCKQSCILEKKCTIQSTVLKNAAIYSSPPTCAAERVVCLDKCQKTQFRDCYLKCPSC